MRFVNVMSASLDGKIAVNAEQGDAERRAFGFTNDDDQAHLLNRLREADAVVIGANSMRASGSAIQEKNSKGTYPHWYVLSNSGLPANLPFLQQDLIPRTLVSKGSLPVHSGVHRLSYGSANAASFLQAHFEQQKYQTVVLLGGGILNGLFYSAGLVDELWLTVVPFLVGKSDAPALVHLPAALSNKWHLKTVRQAGDYLFLHYVAKSLAF